MQTKKQPDGTSLQCEIDISFAELVNIFGKPNTKGDGYKTDAEWNGEIEEQFFTIYNYKTGKNYLGKEGLPVEKIRDWHIGAYNKETALKVVAYIKNFGDKNKVIAELQDKLHRRNLQIKELRERIRELNGDNPTYCLMKTRCYAVGMTPKTRGCYSCKNYRKNLDIKENSYDLNRGKILESWESR